MEILMSDWVKYANKLSKINQRAGEVFQKLIEKNGVDNFNATVEYAKAVIDRYGEASSALTAQMYDELANIQNANVQQAQPATIAKKDEIIGAFKKVQDIARMRSSVERFVKLASADTMLKNAQRDGAEWAWVAIGDTCPFCIMLASQGWVKASKKVIKGDHARHIHAHCDCEFIVRFDGETTIKGYDPDKFLEKYNNASGNDDKDKVNSMRRALYPSIKEERNARRRELYAKNKAVVYKTFASGEEANKYFESEEKRWTGLLSDSEKNSINGYTGTDFTKINFNLRTQGQKDFKVSESITNIDNAISKYRLDDNITVYRVVDRNGIKNIDINNCIGEIYNDEAYMSTSPVYRGVLDGVDDSFTVFKINVPKGKGNGAYINSLSQYQDAEYEFLLKRNTKCRILKVEEIDDKKLLEMEVIPND